MHHISEENLSRHLEVLVSGIGVRLAGTDGEAGAAAYVLDQLRVAGAEAHQESFPVNVRAVEAETLHVRIGDAWRSFPCSLFSNTPGTGGAAIEAPLVFFEAPTEYQRTELAHLRGMAVVHLGCHIESREHYRRLMEAEPAFLLFVDIRYPGSVPLADGMFPAYTQVLGARPTVNVAYMDAWRWRVEGASAARLSVVGGMAPGRSTNIVADLPGTDRDDEVVCVSAHHDTQAASAGADDNASGVAGLLELARVLAGVARRRRLRLISFGAEEQLSVGSATYVRAHRDVVSRHATLMLNLDSYGSWMGWTEIVYTGATELERYLRTAFEEVGLYPRLTPTVVPYADHFPFAAAGVPAVCVTRANCTGGRFFHHRPDDDLTRVSPAVMAGHLTAVAHVATDLLQRDEMPFPSGIPVSQRADVEACWNDLFGGWDPPRS